jgi:transposase-like protein
MVFCRNEKSDVTCPQCKAGYRRIEVASGKKSKGEYRCLLCDHLLEVFDGSSQVAIRLTVQPEKIMNDGDNRFSNPSNPTFIKLRHT